MRVPLPLAEVWAEMQARVEELTGHAGVQILRAIWKIKSLAGWTSYRPNPTAGCVRWGKQPGYVVFAGQKIPLGRHEYERARARKWNWRATVSCSKTENCNERCESAWWPGCPHGTIDERWRVLWKATG